MPQKQTVKLTKFTLDKDREKFLFSAPCKYLVNTQYVIAQNTRAFYRRVNTRNIRIFIRIYYKKPAISLITGLSNYLSYSNAFFG